MTGSVYLKRATEKQVLTVVAGTCETEAFHFGDASGMILNLGDQPIEMVFPLGNEYQPLVMTGGQVLSVGCADNCSVTGCKGDTHACCYVNDHNCAVCGCIGDNKICANGSSGATSCSTSSHGDGMIVPIWER